MTLTNGASTAALQIRTRCAGVDQFIAVFRSLFSTDVLFVATTQSRPVGLETRFVIQLGDGTPILRGDGIVRDSWPTAENPFSRPGIRLEIVSVGADSRSVLNRLASGRPRADSPVSPLLRAYPRSESIPESVPVADEASVCSLIDGEDEAGGTPAASAQAASASSAAAHPSPGAVASIMAAASEPPSSPRDPVIAPKAPTAPTARPRASDPTELIRMSRRRPQIRAGGLIAVLGIVVCGVGYAVLSSATEDESEPQAAAAVAAVEPRLLDATPAPSDVAQGPLDPDGGSPPPAEAANTDPGAVAAPGMQPVATVAQPQAPDGEDERKPCRLTIVTRPKDAMVELDGHTLGQASGTQDVACGKRRLQLSHPRYKTVTRTVTVREAEPRTVEVTLPRPTHTVTVVTSPAGAVISIEGRRVGISPTTIRVAGFQATAVTVTKAGYESVTKRLYSKHPNDRIVIKLATAPTRRPARR